MSERPNVLFIMDDQHRPDYLGCAGASFLRTPNLDHLAARGTRFTRCFTNSPLCAPARIGLATGLLPSRLGALSNDRYLPLNSSTYYQRLRDYGYRVGCIGKLDLAKPSKYNGRFGDRPCVYSWGFTHPEECEGKVHAGNSPTPIGPYTYYLQERGLLETFHQDYRERARSSSKVESSRDSALPTDAFEDAYIGRRTAEWIERIPDDFPWHLFVSFVGPHSPFDPPSEYADRYRHSEMPPAIPDSAEGKPSWVVDKLLAVRPEEVSVTRRQYCAAVELIDDQIGCILDALQRRGLLDNTYVIFASDHGEMLGDHGLYGKSVAYEPSLGVPLIAAGPGIQQGHVSDALVELIDVNPTICELAALPSQECIDAKSFASLLRGDSEVHRNEIVSVLDNFRCIRSDRYKLIQNYNDLSELYDLEEDPQELTNIASERSEVATQLASRLRRRFLEGK